MPTLVHAQNENTKMDKAPPPKAVAVTVAADPCPDRAATPYNAIVVNRPIPNSSLNMPNFVLCCSVPNQNLDPYVAPPCNLFNRCGGGCGGGCDNGCGAILGGGFNRGCGCGNTGCNSGCGTNSCGNGCGNIFGSVNFNRGCGCGCGSSCGTTACNSGCGATTSCNTGCGNSCDRGYRSWQRFSCGAPSNCGCTTGCNTGCGGCNSATPAIIPAAPAAPPATMKPVSGIEQDGDIEQVGCFLRFNKPNTPTNDCQQCPQNGGPQKYGIPTPSTLGCMSCSTWESEHVFIFGTCRQFFGEPTHKWLNGK
jgi:hypothetical protein